MVHSMQESESPITELSAALVRIAQSLHDFGTPLFGESEAKPTGDLQVLHETIARDIAICIESLQFHDRLMQQLALARDILTGLSTNRLLANVPNVSANENGVEGSIELF